MKTASLHPGLRLLLSGACSLGMVLLFPAAGRSEDPGWLLALAALAAAGFVLLVPVLLRGGSDYKRLAALLLFVPCLVLLLVLRSVIDFL